MRATGLLVGISVIVLATGCQGPQGSIAPNGSGIGTASSSGPAPGSSQPIVAGAKPISMTLLSNWKKVELTDAGLRAAIASVATSNPLLAKTLTDLLEFNGYAKFALYAIGSDGDRYLGTVNIAESPVTGLDLASLGQLFEGQVRDAGATKLVSKDVTLPAGPAVQLSYNLIKSSDTAAPPANVDGRLYIFLIEESRTT